MAANNKYYCNYSWVIDSKLFKQMLKAVPKQSFLSDVFSIETFKGRIKAYPNGKYGDGQFTVDVTLSSSHKRNVRYRSRISFVELESTKTEFWDTQYNGDEIGLHWGSNSPTLMEIKHANIDKLTIRIEIQILNITESISNTDILYEKPFYFKGSFQKQQFKWDFDKSLMEQMRKVKYSKSFESNMFNAMWRLELDKNDKTICVSLACCALPPKVSKIDIKWRIYGDSLHVNVTDISNGVEIGHSNYVDIGSFDAFIQVESVSFEVHIDVMKMYDHNGQEIKESNWNKCIQQKKVKAKETGYSWRIDEKLLSTMKAAESGQCFSSNAFKMDQVDFQINAFPKGKKKELNYFYVYVQMLSIPRDYTNIQCYTRMSCDELQFSNRSICDLSFRKQGKFAHFYHRLPEEWNKEKDDSDDDQEEEDDVKELTINVEFHVLKKSVITEKSITHYQYPMNFGKSFRNQQFEWILDGKLMQQMKDNMDEDRVFDSPVFSDMWCLSLTQESTDAFKKNDEDDDKDIEDEDNDDDDDDDEEEEEEEEEDDEQDEEDDEQDEEEVWIAGLGMALKLCGLPYGLQKVKVKWSIFCDAINVNKITSTEMDMYAPSGMHEPIVPWDEFIKYESLAFHVRMEILEIYDHDGDVIEDSQWNQYTDTATTTKEIVMDVNDDEEKDMEQKNNDVYMHNPKRATDIDDRLNQMREEIESLKTQSKSLQQQLDQNNKEMKQMKKKIVKLSGNEEDDDEKKEFSNEDKVRIWLEDTVKLPQYFDVLINDGYDDLEMIADLTVDDLIKMGMDKNGHRKKIIKYAQKLEENQSQPAKSDIEGKNVYDTAK